MITLANDVPAQESANISDELIKEFEDNLAKFKKKLKKLGKKIKAHNIEETDLSRLGRCPNFISYDPIYHLKHDVRKLAKAFSKSKPEDTDKKVSSFIIAYESLLSVELVATIKSTPVEKTYVKLINMSVSWVLKMAETFGYINTIRSILPAMSFVSSITNTNYDVTKYKNSMVLTPFHPTPACSIDGIKEAIAQPEPGNVFAEDAVAVSEGMTSEL